MHEAIRHLLQMEMSAMNSATQRHLTACLPSAIQAIGYKIKQQRNWSETLSQEPVPFSHTAEPPQRIQCIPNGSGFVFELFQHAAQRCNNLIALHTPLAELQG